MKRFKILLLFSAAIIGMRGMESTLDIFVSGQKYGNEIETRVCFGRCHKRISGVHRLAVAPGNFVTLELVWPDHFHKCTIKEYWMLLIPQSFSKSATISVADLVDISDSVILERRRECLDELSEVRDQDLWFKVFKEAVGIFSISAQPSKPIDYRGHDFAGSSFWPELLDGALFRRIVIEDVDTQIKQKKE